MDESTTFRIRAAELTHALWDAYLHAASIGDRDTTDSLFQIILAGVGKAALAKTPR